jgi:hypothetical protein
MFALLPTLVLVPPSAWYGPATVHQTLPTAGNPFSPRENDVRAVFTQRGRRLERLAYFAQGEWHATLAAKSGGTYTVRFTVNGKPAGQPAKVTLAQAQDGDFVMRAGTRFKLTSGKPYVPFGHNFGWQNGRGPSYPEQLADMAKAGLNWTRVWANSWDGKNPYVPPDASVKLELGRMYEPALDRWDTIVRSCEQHRIRLQLVFFHHGSFTTFNDSNWATHPWNTANGGFLASPAEFFTDPKAKELSKAWLRYAVARWGHSPAIMAWELFNEVQWTNAARDPQHVHDVAAWHAEMAAYLKSIDPYRHLVTSSSNENLDPKVFVAMDYEQPHTYPPSIFGALLGHQAPADRPMFYGELGAGGSGGPADQERLVVRDGFWGGLLGGHAGPGQYWFWDRVYRSSLYPEFARLSAVLARSGFAEHPQARPAPIQVTGAPPADLVARPGRGWAATEKFVYDLPADAGIGALPQLSTYIQGAKGGNRAMMKEPIRLRFRAREAGEARFTIGQVARRGGAIEIRVNGGAPVSRSWPAAERDTRVREEIAVPFPPGPVEISIDNPSEDWVTLDTLRIPGAGPGVLAARIGAPGYTLARLSWVGGFGTEPRSITLPGLADGRYELRQWDLDSGLEKVTPGQVTGGLLPNYQPIGRDEAFALFPR